MDTRKLIDTVVRRLLLWSGLSIAAGLGLLLASPFWQGVGVQAVGWGLADAAIALFGTWITRRRTARLDPLAPGVEAQEARSLRRLLRINAGLDVLYVLGGAALALTLGAGHPFWRGTGWGIILQGTFLLLFDTAHARLVPAAEEPIP